MFFLSKAGFRCLIDLHVLHPNISEMSMPVQLLVIDSKVKRYSIIYFTWCHLHCRSGGQPVKIVHRYHFASHLKRMSVVVSIHEKYYAFIKVGIPRDYINVLHFFLLLVRLLLRMVQKQFLLVLAQCAHAFGMISCS